MRALIVEDNALESDFIKAYLGGVGIEEFITTSRLDDALATLATRAFDLIVLDLTLADSTAEKTLQRLPELVVRAGNAGIILATGYQQASIAGAMQYANALLTKPYTSGDVEKIARAVLEARSDRHDRKKKSRMSEEDELAALHAELRERDKADMAGLKSKLDLIMSQLSVMREDFAKMAEFEKLELRVAKLEAERMKLVGGFFVLQAVGGLLMFVISKHWK